MSPAPVRSLGETAQALVDKLDEVHKSPAMQAVWVLHHVHGGRYNGPTYHDELEALRVALLASAPPRPDEWQPIETAPKDEDVLLLYLAGSGVLPGYWDGVQWLACETSSLTGGRWHSEPTHWKPLSDPPVAVAQPPGDQS